MPAFSSAWEQCRESSASNSGWEEEWAGNLVVGWVAGPQRGLAGLMVGLASLQGVVHPEAGRVGGGGLKIAQGWMGSQGWMGTKSSCPRAEPSS